MDLLGDCSSAGTPVESGHSLVYSLAGTPANSLGSVSAGTPVEATVTTWEGTPSKTFGSVSAGTPVEATVNTWEGTPSFKSCHSIGGLSVGTLQISEFNMGGTPPNTVGFCHNFLNKFDFLLMLRFLFNFVKNTIYTKVVAVINFLSMMFSLNFLKTGVINKNHCKICHTRRIGGGETKKGDNGDYVEPTFSHLQNNRHLLLFSERLHNNILDLYLDDNQVNGLICGVAAFVGRKGIRKVAVLPSIFCTVLAADSSADPVTYMEVYKDGYDILLAPIVTGFHWYLAAFYVHEKVVVVYDSLHKPVPSIFTRLKTSVESALGIRFTLQNKNNTINVQENGYDCGVHCFGNAEEICFHGKCRLLVPYYSEAERARAREILRKLKDKEITDEWVPAVENPSDFVNLNRPTNPVQANGVTTAKKENNVGKNNLTKEDDDDCKVLFDKKAIKNETMDISFEANEMVKNIGKVAIVESQKYTVKDMSAQLKNEENKIKVEKGIKRKTGDYEGLTHAKKVKVDEEFDDEELMDIDKKEPLSFEEEEKLINEMKETFIDYCNRKKIKKDKKARADFNSAKAVLNKKLEDNEKLKDESNINIIVKNNAEANELMEIEDKYDEDNKVISAEEEIKLQNVVKESYDEFCKRKKIKKNLPKSKNLYKKAIKTAEEKLYENERIKECKTKKRSIMTDTDKDELKEMRKIAKENMSQKSLLQNKNKEADDKAQRRLAETENEKEERLKRVADSMQNLRENETEEETSQRLKTVKTQMAVNRTMTKLEKQETLKKEREKRIANLKKLLPFIVRKGAEIANVEPFKLGNRDVICKGCGAKHYRTEKIQKDGTFTSCCKQGKIKMDASVADYPQHLKELMTKKHKNEKYVKIFDINKRMINSSLSCAHMYAKNINLAPGVPYLKIQGKVLHKMPRTYFPSNDNATFGGQNYIVDSAEATMARVQAGVKNNIKLNEELMKELDETIRQNNVFAKSYTMLKETMDKQKANEEETGEKAQELRLVFKGKPNAKRNYDRVEAENEIALVYTPGPDGEIPRDDIVIYDKHDGNNTYEVLPEWDPRVEPLSYTLFYPNGKGTFYDRQFCDPDDPKSGKLTEREYYAFKISERDEEIYGFNPILHGGKLFLQYLCDAWAKVEGDRLRYLNMNQKKLKVASYKDVQEHLEKQAQKTGKAPGSVKILPSTFYGGPRYLRELCSDAISMVDEYGKPTAMVTMTVNPEDEDIINNLYENQKAWERPDIVNSCFYQKMHELIRVIEKEQIFGPVVSSVVVVEFQKRGLPHCHCAFTLKEKWDTKEKVDAYIRAFLPPLTQEEADKCGEIFDEEYLAFVKKFMIHTPCGIHNPNAPCMVNGKCKRNFPRCFIEDTVMDDNGFTRPRRPDNGRSFTMKVNGNEVEVDNRWVVPHNPYLLKYMRSHLNVEAINSIATVFYVFKYMFKGDDKAFVEMNEFIDNEIIQALNYNEIKSYEDFRYISATEAHWRLSDFWLYKLSHSVDRLPVHLENEQNLYMGEDADEEDMKKAKDKNTKLMAFFEVNKQRAEEIAKDKETIAKLRAESKPVNHITVTEKILFNKIGIDHVWDGKNGKWNPRQKTTKPKLCRLYNVNPKRTNCFYLRRLLMAVPGPTSFEDLRTVDGVLYPTNREACVALGLVVNDKLYEDTLFEALNHTNPNQFRYLFARLLAHCDLGNPLELFDKFENHLIKDLLKKWQKDDAKNVAWRRIVKSMLNQDKHLSDYPELEAYMKEIGFENEETIDVKALYAEGEANYAIMNEEQKAVVDAINERLETKDQKSAYFYVDGIGGSGKSYTFSTIRKLTMGKSFKVVIMAWSGIAASLYPMGRTCHNAFKLEFPFENDSNCGVSPTSPHGKMLEEADIIIWDEFPMAPKRALEVVDMKLKEIMGNDTPGGGKIILCGGDFRQCAPIVENGTVEEIIGTSVCCSPIWKHFQKFKLTENKRALPHENEFKQWLIEVGDGVLGENPNEIEIPEQCRSQGDIIDEIFGDVMDDYDPATVMKRAILATWNEDVDVLNEQVLDLLDEETEVTYHAQDVYHYGDEMLQSVGEIHQNYKTKNIKGLPSYRLRLRKNAIVMLIRNLSIEDGLCNGTRLVVTNLLKHNLVVKKINIDGTLSDEILIPRISLTAKHGVVDVTRHQFPVKLGFCMTINKSQGQTMDKVGVVLKHECFSHGQLYVAFSRVRSFEGLKVVTSEDKTTTANVVYKKLLELGRR